MDERGVAQAEVGIIGGTGLGNVLQQQADGTAVDVETPYGPPASRPILAEWEGVRVAFIARHGPGHRYNPTNVPYRANIWALRQLGVHSILASGAVGSLQEEIAPRHLVICDQVIDKTHRRASTFFDAGPVVHVALADPFCPRLRAMLDSAAAAAGTAVHASGTYVCMEGPQFSTRAEAHMHRAWGGDLIGMTCMPEAKLAREAQICYALVALVTDYDCWRPAPPGGHDHLIREVLDNLHVTTDSCVALFRAALREMSQAAVTCHCRTALKLAVWSDVQVLDPVVRQRLALLLEPESLEEG